MIVHYVLKKIFYLIHLFQIVFYETRVTTFKAKQQVDRLNAQATVSETEKSESQSTVSQTESKELTEESPTKSVAEDPAPDPPQEPITSSKLSK